MIKVVARHVVKPECVEAFLASAKEVVEASVNDAGNIYYTLNRHVDNPLVYTILEAWQDNDSLQAHMQTEHFQRLVPPMQDLLSEPACLDVYEEVC